MPNDDDLLTAVGQVIGKTQAQPEAPTHMPASNEDPLAEAARDAVGSQASTIRNNLINAQGVNPAEASRVQQLAKTTGLPTETVRAQPEVAQARATLASTDANMLVQKYPHLAQFMSQPDNAAQVHTFVPEMAQTEEAVKSLPVISPAAKPFDFVSAFERNLAASIPSVAPLGELAKGFAGSYNRAATAVNITLGGIPTIYDKMASIFAGSDSTKASDWWFRNMIDPAIARQQAYETAENAGFVAKAANTAGNMLGMMNQIILTGGESTAVPATATTGELVKATALNATRSMAFPAISSAVNTGQKVYAVTGDPHQALLAAEEEWAASTAMGATPLSAPGGLAKRLATGFVSGAASGEVARQAANLVMPNSLQQPFDIEQAILSGLSGAILGGAMGPREHTLPAGAPWMTFRNTYTDTIKAQQSERDMQNLHYLGAVAEANPLRKNNPEAFRQFIQTMADEREISDVYVNAKNLDDALKSNAVEGQAFLQKAPDVAAQIQEQAALNGDVRIPVADYVTYIAGKPINDVLLPHLKTAPDGMTYAEGQAFFQNATADMKAQADKIVKDQVVTEQQKAEHKEIYDNVLAQLNNVNRFPADVNRVHATITAAGYVARAKAAGMTPAELWAKFPLNVEGGAFGGDIAGALQQAPEMSPGEIQAAKQSAKQAVRGELKAGRVTSEHAFRGTTDDELRTIARTGRLLIGSDAEGNSGISAARIEDGNFPVYGRGAGYIVPPESTADSGRWGEVLVEPKTDPRMLKYVVDGKVMTFDEMRIAEEEKRSAYLKSQPIGGERTVTPQEPREMPPGTYWNQPRVEINANRPLVNIGLNVNDGGKITPEQAEAALKKVGVEIKRSAIHESNTEPTLVAQLSRALTPAEAHRVSVELKQDAIAQAQGMKGGLYGPEAAKWGEFNPEYFLTMEGKPLSQKPEGVTVVAQHFSNFPRTLISGNFYGTGLKGAEARRLAETKDSRLKNRVAAYVDEGKGVTPEAGVGAVKHTLELSNLYDLRENPLHLDTSDANALESAILDAGYSGYYLRNWTRGQGAAVVLGDAARAITPKHVELTSEGYKQAKEPRVVDTPQFKEWFGGSKVVDSQGEPQVMYHGTKADFTSFKRRVGDIGIHFGTAGQAQNRLNYAGGPVPEGANVMPVYLRIRNPLRLPDVGFWNVDTLAGPGGELKRVFPEDAKRIQALKSTKDIREFIQSKGYDGIVYKNEGETTGAEPYAKAADEAHAKMKAVFPVGKNTFTPEDQKVPEYKAWRAAQDAYREFREANAEDSYIVFERNQVKSAIGNAGTFNPRDASILRQAKPPFYSALERTIPELKGIASKDGTVDAKQAKAWLDARQKEGKFKKTEVEATGLDDWIKLQGGRVSVADVENFVKQNGVQVEDVMLGEGKIKPIEWTKQSEDVYTDPVSGYRLRHNSVGKYWEVENEDGNVVAYNSDLAVAKQQAEGALRSASATTKVKYQDYQLPGGENYHELLLTLPPTKVSLPQWEIVRPDGRTDFSSTYASEEAAHIQASRRGEGYTVRPAETKQLEGGFRSSHFNQLNILAHIRFNERTDAEGKRVLFLEELQSDWGQKGKKQGFAGTIKKENLEAKWHEPTIPEGADPSVYSGYWEVFDKSTGKLLIRNPDSRAKTAQEAVDAAYETWVPVAESNLPPRAPFVTDTKAWTALALKRMIRYAAEHGFDRVAWTTGEQQAARYDLSKQIEKISAWRMDSARGLYTLDIRDKKGLRHGYDDIPEAKLGDLVGKELAKKIVESPEVDDKGVHLEGLDLKIGGEGMKGYYDKIVPQVATDIVKKLGGKVGEIEMVSKKGRPTQYANFAEYSKAPEETRTKQQSIEITPEMRDAVMEGQPLFQEAHAAYVPDTATIHLLKDANLSSFTHELGHHFLEMTDQLADTSPVIRKDMDVLLNWFGKTPEEWKGMTLEERRPFHEKFAESFERYLLEGHAPSLELRPVFERVRNWMVSVYKSLQGLLAARPQAEQLNTEVRQVFDRMLATEESIKQAEAVKGYEPLFRSAEEAKQAGMSEQAYKDYLSLGERATSEAISDMERKAMRDMRWLSGAKSRMLRELQRDAASKRREIREEVIKEVENTPVERAHKALSESEIKLSSEELSKQGYKPEELAKLKGLVAKEGLPPDMAADALGFSSGDVLVRGLLDREDPTHAIDGLTDQRMLERYGELSDPQAIERAANQAIANDARARFMATGLKVLTKSPVSASALAKAAKAVAEEAIGRKKVSELNPATYDIQEAKANKAAIKAAPKDPLAAVKAQREALLNNRMSRAANDAITDIRKGLDYLKRFSKDSVRSKIDVDIRDQIDDLLSRFDLRQNVTTTPTRAQLSLRDWVASQEAAGYTPLVTPDMADPAVRMHYKEMTVDQFRGLHDTIKALEHVGKERQYAMIAGERMNVDEYVRNELAPKILSRGVKFSPEELVDRPEDRHTNPIAIAFDHFNSWRRSAAAELMPQSQKANFYDRHEILGPFNKAITSRVLEANYNKVRMLKGLSDDFQAQAKLLGREWQNSLRDSVKNDRLIDPDTGKLLSFTRGRMIGMAIHVGNESNFHKLTAGWNFKGEDVWRFLHDNMTEKDWQATQAVWDLYEKHWPEVDAMNRRLGNTSPQKIEARPFKTNFGEQRGGYAAIAYDPLRSRRGERAAAGQAINPTEGLFTRGYFRADTTTNGSLNARLENYIDRVDLDFHSIPQRLQETIHDLAYREALIDVNKVIEHPEFRKAVRSVHGREAYKSLQDWLGNLANAHNQDQQIGALGRFLQYTRTGMVINAIAFRASTVIKHGGSAAFKSMGYFAGGGEKYFARRMAAMGTNYTQEIEGARQKFGEIFSRLLQQDRDFKQTSNSMFEPESLQAKGERFGHAMVAWSDMMTAVPTAWAAYDRAIAEGIPVSQGGTGKPMTEAQAVDYANRIVREAHGSYTESGRSLVLSSKSEAMKMFTTLYSFMNNAYGQQLDGFDKLRTAGISSAPVLARTFAAIIIPALVAGYVKSGLPKENEVESWAEWAGEAIADEVAASVPFVRDAVAMVEGYQHAGMVAAENWLAALVLAGKDLAKGTGKPIRDFANAVGMALHIPGLGQLGSSLQYAEDVKEGKKTPQSQAELVKGVIVGH